MVFLTLVCILLILVLISLYLRFCRAGRLISKIPGPRSWPLIGNTIDILLPSDQLFTYMRSFYTKYGTVNRMHGFNIRSVNIYEPEDVEIVLSTTRFIEKQYPYNFMRPWLCEGLLTGNGEKWQQRRKLLTPAFHFKIIRQFGRIFVEQTQEFLRKIELEVGKPKSNIIPLITKATLRIMCETSMGTTMHEGIDSISNKYFNAIHTLGQCVLYRLLRAWLYIDWIFQLTPVARTQKQALKDVHRFTNQIIQERKIYREQNKLSNIGEDCEVYGIKGRLAMLDLLLENEKEGKIDLDGIREEVDTFLFEGHDTTAMALIFMIMRIANEPQVQERIYEELQKVFTNSDRDPSVEDLSELKYLECCIKESMRLYPSVPFIARYIAQEVTLGGYVIPTNTTCQINVFDIHRRADIYPDPEKFIPERFLPENCSKRHPYAYIPFSAGPRNCIGQKFAMLEMKTVMSGLLRRFLLEPVTTPSDITFNADLVLRTTHPIYVRFCKRLN